MRLSYFKNSNGSAEVLEENNYYPFGMKHEGYNALVGNPASGTAGEVGTEQWKEAKKDLDSKSSNPISDVHLHTLVYDSEGKITSYGLPKGSPTDLEPKNNKGYTEPNIVLGYKEDITPIPSGQIGGAPTVEYIPVVGFYNTDNNPIITIDFSKLQSTIKKINEQ